MKTLFAAIKHHYTYNLLLSRKIIISYCLLLALPTIAVSLFLYGQIYDIVINDTIRSEQAIADQTAKTVEATLRQISNAAGIIAEDSYLKKLTARKESKPFPATPYSSESASFISSVKSLADKKTIQNIVLYLDPLLAPPDTGKAGGLFCSMEEAKGTYWYGICNNTPVTQLHCPSFYLSPSEISAKGSMALIQRVPYGDSPQKTAAYIAVYYNQSTLDNLLKQNINDTGVAYLINERNSIAASSNSSLVGIYYMDRETLETSIKYLKTFVTKDVLNESVYAGYYPIEETEWYLVSVLPSAPLLNRGNSLMLLFVRVYLLFLLLALLLSILLSRTVTRRISSVINQMKLVRAGRLLPLDAVGGKDEIGDLVDTYNYMSGRINSLMEEQERAAEQLRTSEFRALQAQINPHFLYNTLDMINWLSQSGRNKEVTKAVQALSGFYKLTLSKQKPIDTIARELEHITLYVKLQNMRYQDKISLLVDVPDELMDYCLPKLTFQPVVENAIQHGIFEKDEKKGSIVVTAWKEETGIVILISDDGVGMDDAAQQSILSGAGKSRTGSNIGIFNTHQRLVTLYGKEYGLSYESSPGLGTEVAIRIPPLTEADPLGTSPEQYGSP